jgi:hypothetical protein
MELFVPVGIISDSPLAQCLLEERPGVQIISPQELLAAAEVQQGEVEDVPTTLDHVLAYMFTSGSTGKSKCVTATNRMAYAEIQAYPQIFKNLNYKVDPRIDRWRNDHEMGWWGAAYFGEIDVALAMGMCIVMMTPRDVDLARRGVTVMGALPSQLQNLWPGARNIPKTLRVIFSWAERCDVELGRSWKKAGVKMVDLLIASEFWLSLASCNLEVATGEDGRVAHVMRAVEGATIHVLDKEYKTQGSGNGGEVSGMLGIGGPQVSPGYAEKLDSGITAIGAGEQSRDTFKRVDGQCVVVPKDLVRKRADHSFLSMGRGGGTVKIKGGVLMATNIVELDLQKDSIAAACITDPLHVEGGSCCVLEIDWKDVWSLRDCLVKTSFLRMPVLFVCIMKRNSSTGKVQKALVQGMLEEEQEAEVRASDQLKSTQKAQLLWYCKLVWPFIVPCIGQPWTLFMLAQALTQLDWWHVALCLLRFLGEALLRISLLAWTYCAPAHANNLGAKSASAGPLLVVLTGSLCNAAVTNLVVASVFLALVTFQPLANKFLDYIGRISFALLLGLAPRFFCSSEVTWYYALGLLSLIATNRTLPMALQSSHPALCVLQRVIAVARSFCESLGYMLCVTVVFLLALPNTVLNQYPDKAWQRLLCQGQPLAQKQSGKDLEPYLGHRNQLDQIRCESTWNGGLWVDINHQQRREPEAPVEGHVKAQTPAGAHAQLLAKKAGVDFHSVDSLRIARLSVMLKKGMAAKPGEEPLEFNELREACVDEATFVTLIDNRMMLLEDTSPKKSCESSQVSCLQTLKSWIQGGTFVHREGPTPAPWDCQVDILMEWQGESRLDENHLRNALRIAASQHPLLRALPPPDDNTDKLMGNGCCDFSTTAAATWALVTACWSGHASWSWLISRGLQWVVAQCLWWCWPRTVVMQTAEDMVLNVQALSKESDGHAANVADEVHDFLGDDATWKSWWDPRSMVNVCVINLDAPGSSRQFLYATTSHKYSDGGGAAAFVRALVESYDSCVTGQSHSSIESPVLQLQSERLWTYLSGQPCSAGSVDAYFQDINSDTFYHDIGNSIPVSFTDRVCDLLRVVGLRVGCSEEIAWLSCMACALCRLMPHVKVLKIMMVHNGRLGDAEGSVACVSQYVMLSIPCSNERSNTPLADIASRVKYAVTNGKFMRPAPCEQAHAKINIGGMVGKDGCLSQVFRSHRSRKPGRSRAPHIVQLRMDNEGGTWMVKDFKCHRLFEARQFWQAVVCAGLEIAEGWFTNPLSWD